MSTATLCFSVSFVNVEFGADIGAEDSSLEFSAKLVRTTDQITEWGQAIANADWWIAFRHDHRTESGRSDEEGDGGGNDDAVGAARYSPSKPSAPSGKGFCSVEIRCSPTHFSRLLSSLQAGFTVEEVWLIVEGPDAAKDAERLPNQTERFELRVSRFTATVAPRGQETI